MFNYVRDGFHLTHSLADQLLIGWQHKIDVFDITFKIVNEQFKKTLFIIFLIFMKTKMDASSSPQHTPSSFILTFWKHEFTYGLCKQYFLFGLCVVHLVCVCKYITIRSAKTSVTAGSRTGSGVCSDTSCGRIVGALSDGEQLGKAWVGLEVETSTGGQYFQGH